MMTGINGRWVGIDVSISKLDVALLDDKGETKSHVFNNDGKGLAASLTWIQSRSCDKATTKVYIETLVSLGG